MHKGGFKGWEFDIGAVAFAANNQVVEVSLPHILGIFYNVLFPAPVFVRLFNSFKSLHQINFGNPVTITVTYLSNGGGIGPQNFTYSELLNSLIQNPIEVGITRIDTSTQAQANSPLYRMRNTGVGKFTGETKYPLTYNNQFIRTITYVQEKYTIDGFTQLSFLQRNTDPFVTMYFYNNRSLDVARAFSNENVIQQYGQPQTSFENNVHVGNAYN